jgi:hypothetical protein
MRCASRVENVHGLIYLARNTPACDHTGNGARDAAPPLSLHTGHALCVGVLPGPARAPQGGLPQTGSAAWLPASGVRRGASRDGWVQCGPPAASVRECTMCHYLPLAAGGRPDCAMIACSNAPGCDGDGLHIQIVRPRRHDIVGSASMVDVASLPPSSDATSVAEQVHSRKSASWSAHADGAQCHCNH